MSSTTATHRRDRAERPSISITVAKIIIRVRPNVRSRSVLTIETKNDPMNLNSTRIAAHDARSQRRAGSCDAGVDDASARFH